MWDKMAELKSRDLVYKTMSDDYDERYKNV